MTNKQSTVIIVALESEFSSKALSSSSSKLPIIYSGMGKINAALAVFQAFQQYQPELIINYGTAGKINPKLSGLVEIKKTIQRDMITDSMAPRGVVPFSNNPNEFYSKSGQYTCGTGDSFVESKDDWLIDNQVDLVDMELFSIAAVAYSFGIEWTSFKFISDDANNDNSVKQWQNEENLGEQLFLDKLKELELIA